MFLGIDCGTQGTKALVIDSSGNPLGRGYARHNIIETQSGAREQHPEWWVEALCLAVKEALSQGNGKEIQAISVSGQQHGLVVLDGDKNVIRPAKLWNDTETAPQNERLIALLGGPQACFEHFGIIPLTGYTASKLLWLKECEPENFARIRHILLPHEYLNFWLTGNMCAEFGDASGTGYFDVRSRRWLREILDIIDGGTGQLFASLPPLIAFDKTVGTVKEDAASALGLSTSCLVAAGGGDNMMGAIGTGNVREGIVTLSLGTSSTVYSFHEEPVLDPSGNVAPFCSSSDGWLPLVCTMNATNVVSQTLHLLGKTVSDIDGALDSTSPGADGLVFLPFLNGERTPNLPLARGTLAGISSVNFTPSHLIRAVVEGVSFGILNGLDLMQAGKPVDRIRVIGGGSRSEAWRQLLADATGATVDVPLEEEAGCFGAAMQAMYAWSCGTSAPQSFLDIIARCVKLDTPRTAEPRSEFLEPYRKARSCYKQVLQVTYSAV